MKYMMPKYFQRVEYLCKTIFFSFQEDVILYSRQFYSTINIII